VDRIHYRLSADLGTLLRGVSSLIPRFAALSFSLAILFILEPYNIDFVRPQNNLMTLPKGAEKGLYSDLPDEEAEKYYELLEPHSQDAFETPVDYIAADVTVPMTYIVTEQDAVFPAAGQRAILAAAAVPGIQVESIEASHSPFASRPEELADLIVRISGAAE
jgi:pimeloyl-ACP methyl ester carboxylesterase